MSDLLKGYKIIPGFIPTSAVIQFEFTHTVKVI